MQNVAKLKQAISDGVAYIAGQQLPGGGFKSFSSPSKQDFQSQKIYQTTFVPSLILAALSVTDSADSQAIRESLATFLINEASPAQSFNYWSEQASEHRSQPYPDDLDDTFCALSSLFLHDQKIITEQVLAQSIKLLLATETAVGGPYRTWLVPKTAESAWLDIDLAVNSNIAYFLSLVSKPLPNLTRWIDEAIVQDKLVSPYYPSAYPIAYYMARGYSGRQKDCFIKLLEKLLEAADTPLEIALCLSSLARLDAGGRQPTAMRQLIASQDQDGSGLAAAFCLDPAIDGQTYYNGAAALTTAFAVEALELCRRAGSTPTAARRKRPTITKHAHWQPVLALARRQCGNLAPELRTTTLNSLQKLATSRNGAEIISLPQGLNRSLRRPLIKSAENFFDSLSLANLYGWLAYTIYDDFLDEEGKPHLLPSANVAMRGSLRCFDLAMPRKPSFQALVRQAFDTIDGANAWEVAHCRFPVQGNQITIQKLPDYQDLSQLAERSLGHTLTPLAVLSAKGINVKDAAFRQAREALRHYLIVRQLNDDVHDWQVDLRNGHVSYVVGQVLLEAGVKPGTRRLAPLLAKTQRQFWQTTLPVISRIMQQHIDLSRQALEKSQLLAADNTIARLLGGFETSLAETLATQRQTINFLQHYTGKAAAR
jgi:hypothetical protein